MHSPRAAQATACDLGLLERIEASWLPDALDNWILWASAVREMRGADEDPVLAMVHDTGGQVGFVSATARKRPPGG